MSDITTSERRRQLDELANAEGQPNQPMALSRPPHGHAVERMPEGNTSILPMGAQQVKVKRDRTKILRDISEEAAAAGERWYYRFPVRDRASGGTSYIEGASVKLAEAVARLYMNNVVQVARVEDWGNAWLIIMRFCDLESGTILERPFQQSKAQVTVKTKDYERQQQMAFSVGVSKATRNVITNAIGTYCDFAEEEARNSLVDKIGRDLNTWRQRTIDSCRDLPVEINRVERVIGRAVKDWLAPDIAKIVAMGRAVKDGMATVDETFPPLPADVEATPKAGSSAGTTSPAEEQGAGASLASASAPTTEPGPAEVPVGDAAPVGGTASGAASPLNDEARERGRKAFRAGHSQKAVPQDYRGKPEANSWLAGYQEEADKAANK